MIPALVPAEEAATVWPLAAPLLAPAFEHGRDYCIGDALPLIAKGTWSLWIVAARGAMVAACITEALDFPARRKLWIVAAGGDMRRGVPALWPLLQAAAEAQGCAAVAWQGRRGWGRSGVLPDGARHVADVMEVVL